MEVLKDIQIICCDVNELVVTDKAKLIGKKLRVPIAKHEEILTSEVF